MSDKKIIIRNCPCLFNSYYASGKTVRFECNDGNHYDKLCRDVTDCILKQIVSNLKQVACACHCDNCDGCGYYEGCSDTECGTYQAIKSLELLDIEDIE